MTAADLMLRGPGESYVKVVADSISVHTGDRVTSFELRFHRLVLAELNTHSVLNRNSASSRAIPVEKVLERYLKTPAYPFSWPCEQKGMSGGTELEGDDYLDAVRLWDSIHSFNYSSVRNYLAAKQNRFDGIVDEEGTPEWKKHTLHKSLLNRHLEPLSWHTALVTASSYENMFAQRCDPNAQPEFRIVAELMQELYRKSEPTPLHRGQWHLPYIARDEVFEAGIDLREISTARCARTSLMTQSGVRDPAEDLRLYNETLLGGMHMSPFAHVATPEPRNVADVPISDPDGGHCLGSRRLPAMGHYVGWQEWRHVVEGRRGHASYR